MRGRETLSEECADRRAPPGRADVLDVGAVDELLVGAVEVEVTVTVISG